MGRCEVERTGSPAEDRDPKGEGRSAVAEDVIQGRCAETVSLLQLELRS